MGSSRRAEASAGVSLPVGLTVRWSSGSNGNTIWATGVRSPRGSPWSSTEEYSTKRNQPMLWAARYRRVTTTGSADAGSPSASDVRSDRSSTGSKDTAAPPSRSRKTPKPRESRSRSENPASGSAAMARPAAVEALGIGDQWRHRGVEVVDGDGDRGTGLAIGGGHLDGDPARLGPDALLGLAALLEQARPRRLGQVRAGAAGCPECRLGER